MLSAALTRRSKSLLSQINTSMQNSEEIHKDKNSAFFRGRIKEKARDRYWSGSRSCNNLAWKKKKFSDEGGKAIMRKDNAKVEKRFDFFMADKSEGLTQAGMARLSQSIKAFLYCIVGAQVIVRSSILGSSGSANEAQREFLVLVEGPIRRSDILKSTQRFQFATEVCLDLAVLPGT